MSVLQSLGSLDVALAHAKRLLEKNADLAAEQAREILKMSPGHPSAALILGAAHRRAGRPEHAVELLESLAIAHPNSAPILLELGVAAAESGRTREALSAFRRAVQLQPASADGWRLLADCADAEGDVAAADQARARYLKAASQDPRLREAADALVENNLPLADKRLRVHLDAFPTDVAALRMLAEVAGRLRRYSDAEELLGRCLELAPSFDAARYNYAGVLNRQMRPADALEQVEQLLLKEPRNPGYLNLKAAILANQGEYADSIEVYESVLRDYPRQPKVWMSYGHALKTVGRPEASIAAYRQAIGMEPSLGEAYWSLANLKIYSFTAADVAQMRNELESSELSSDDRLHFEFALGKSLEDAAAYEESFLHYAEGNSIRLKEHPYSAEENTRFVRRAQQLFTPKFFADRVAAGVTDADPIFIVGLPRAGSTLLEQILASHSQVEGTIELPDMPQIARELAGKEGLGRDARFFEAVGALSPSECKRLGERYLSSTRARRKTAKPFFIDKMPNNCLYVGLIRILLPNAKIIDARRHPLGCCFSAFKQHFSRGQSFTYSLADLGRYYRDYVEMMAHIDRALPGCVHRVIHEHMIDDTEGEVRRLLEFCGLPFEEACLRFYENERPVRTASSEQVRRPIFKDGIDHWRHFEPWLGALRESLGSVLDAYPEAPVLAKPEFESIKN